MATINNLEDRGIAYPPTAVGESNAASHDSSDLFASVWRYRWAVLLPAIVGGLIGYMSYLRTPESYRATTRLIVESDRAAILDAVTGDVIGGVPGIELVKSHLFSDRVGEMAYNHEEIQPFHGMFNDDPASFIATAQGSLTLDPQISDNRSAQTLVFLMHFQHGNPELCRAAVEAYSSALQQFFNERHRSSRGELIRLIDVAIKQLHPEMTEVEQKYRDFRSSAPLAWDAGGDAINPHRERQLFLVQRRSELTEQLRQKETEMAAVRSIAKESKDPFLALDVIGQLLNVSINYPGSENLEGDFADGDAQLAEMEVDEKLIPLMIERNKFAAEFGDNHPTVKQLDSELQMMRTEFKRLVREQSQRIVELAEQRQQRRADPAERALEVMKAVIYSGSAEADLLKQQISELDELIAEEKKEAIKLAHYEHENHALLREIDRTRQLMDQLEEQMARISLTEEEGGTRVDELTAPTGAYRVGPNMTKSLGMSGFMGLAIGIGLALLLEKNANTFRTAEEVTEMLGVPVLAHVPFFKGRIKRAKRGEEANGFMKLDPYLAVVHQPASIVAESIRTCRTSVFFEMAGPGGKILQVTSPLPGDGKSTVSGNLACSIAQSGKKVLAIDCDLRRPQFTDNFALADETGLTNVLNGDCERHEACHQTAVSNLHVMPSGPIPSNPAEALTLPEMSEMLEELREEYDYIILDTPPLLVVTDPSITASMADGVILTLRVRRKSKPNAREAVNILRGVGARILGLVINDSDEASVSDGYRGYGYYRYGRPSYTYTGNGPEKKKSSRVTVSGHGLGRSQKAGEINIGRDQSSDLIDSASVD